VANLPSSLAKEPRFEQIEISNRDRRPHRARARPPANTLVARLGRGRNAQARTPRDVGGKRPAEQCRDLPRRKQASDCPTTSDTTNACLSSRTDQGAGSGDWPAAGGSWTATIAPPPRSCVGCPSCNRRSMRFWSVVGCATGCLTKTYERNSPKRVVPDFRACRAMLEFDHPMASRARGKQETSGRRS
jgi:hypothetical protein